MALLFMKNRNHIGKIQDLSLNSSWPTLTEINFYHNKRPRDYVIMGIGCRYEYLFYSDSYDINLCRILEYFFFSMLKREERIPNGMWSN